MSQEPFVSKLKAALDVAPPDPALRARVMSSLPLDRRRAGATHLRWAGAIAAALAVAIVAGLLFLGPLRPSSRTHSATGPIADCSLPVYGLTHWGDQHESMSYQYGFLDVANGTLTSAAAGSLHLVGLPGGGGISYDAVLDMWFPVPANWLAADGMSYVYLNPDSQGLSGDLHLRDLRPGGSDRVLVHSKAMRLLGWVGGRIYYASGADYEWGLWEVDPRNGQDREVAPPSMSEWWRVGPGAVWGSPAYSGAIARYDTATGIVSTWHLDRVLETIGADSFGHAIVLRSAAGSDSSTEGEPMLMLSPDSAVAIGANGEVLPTNVTVIADGDRVWFSASDRGIWLYSPDTGLVKLDPALSGLVVAGGCV